MRGTKQVGIWSEMRSFWQPHPTQDQPAPPEGFEIDYRIGAAAPRAPAASKENSRPQAILKSRPPNNLDYKARHGPQTWFLGIAWVLFHPVWHTCSHFLQFSSRIGIARMYSNRASIIDITIFLKYISHKKGQNQLNSSISATSTE